MKRQLWFLALGLGCLACGKDATSTDGNFVSPPACSGNIPVVVSFRSTNGTPLFDWAPQCGVALLNVETVPGPGEMPVQIWWVMAPENKPFGPTVVFGETPRGAASSTPSQ